MLTLGEYGQKVYDTFDSVFCIIFVNLKITQDKKLNS